MKSPAQYITKMLELAEPSGSGWLYTYSAMPDKPDNRVTVYDRPANKDGRLMRTGEVIEHPGIMVMVRAKTYNEGWSKAKEIEAYLDATHRESVTVGADTVVIQAVSRASGVNTLGPDPSGNLPREFFSLNVSITINQ